MFKDSDSSIILISLGQFSFCGDIRTVVQSHLWSQKFFAQMNTKTVGKTGEINHTKKNHNSHMLEECEMCFVSQLAYTSQAILPSLTAVELPSQMFILIPSLQRYFLPEICFANINFAAFQNRSLKRGNEASTMPSVLWEILSETTVWCMVVVPLKWLVLLLWLGRLTR